MTAGTDLKAENHAILTTEDIRQWQDRFSEISEEIGEARRKIADLEGERSAFEVKFKAASLFAPDITQWLSEQVPPAEEIALTEAIIKALQTNGPKSIARDRLKSLLPAAGYAETKLNANPNYLYVAIKRLLTREKIVEVEEGTYKIKPAG